MADKKVQLILEAYDKTKAAFNELKNNFQRALKDVDNFKLRMDELSNTFKNLITAAAFYKIGRQLESTIDTAEQMQNSLRGLAAIARYSGEDIGKSIDTAMKLSEDGLVSVQDAAQALQNLLSRGFTLTEAIQMIERLKDAAAFNRQASLSMSDAVRSATEGLKNENSILVDNAGVTKNVSVMWKEYAAEIGKGVNELTQAEKRQAEFNGIMRETEGQVGNAKLALEGITGTKAKLNVQILKLKNSIGETLIPAFLKLAETINWVLDNAVKPFLGGIEIIGARIALWWEKLKIILKIPFEGGLLGNKESIKKQFEELDKIFEKYGTEIAEKWEGKVKVPLLGKDTGKRRQDIILPGDDKAKKDAEDLAFQLAKLEAQWLKEEEEYFKKAEKAREWLTDRTNQLTLSEFDYKRAKLLEEYEEIEKYLGWTDELYNDFKNDLKKIDDEEIENTKSKQRQIRDLELQHQLAVIDIKEKTFQISEKDAIQQRIDIYNQYLKSLDEDYQLTVGIKEKDEERLQILNKIAEMQDIVTDLLLRQEELTGNFVEGMRRGLSEWIRDIKTNFEEGRDFFLNTMSEIHSGLEQFFDYASDGFTDFGKLAKDILHEIYMELMKLLVIKPIMKNFSSLLSGLLGGSTSGTGQEFLDLIPEGQEHGGTVKKGKLYFVGEKGVELFAPGMDGAIIPNHMIPQMVGGGNKSLTVNVPITVDSGNKRMISELRSEIEETAIRVIRRYS